MKWVAIIGCFASPVAAQEFTPPAGCELHLTVQNRDCVVDQHFTCTADPMGDQHRASFDENAMIYLGTIDNETQWVHSSHVQAGYTEVLETVPSDRASFSELLETGSDDYDFQTSSAEVGVTRYVGRDELTGQQRVIDGVTLDETTFNITAYGPEGSLLWASEGREYISKEFRMFLSGKSTVTTPTDTYQDDGTPVQFIRSGEVGFGSVKPNSAAAR